MRSLLLLALLMSATACQGADSATSEPSVVGIPTAEPPGGEQGCRLRLNSGVLVADDEVGLAVQNLDGSKTVIVWPHGWSAIDQDGIRILLNDQRDPVARVGEEIAFGGAEGPGGRVRACGEIERMP